MANNYTQFSEVVANLTAEEAAWWEQQLKEIVVVDGKEIELDDDEQPAVPDEHYRGYRLWLNTTKVPTAEVDDPFYLGFEHELSNDDEPDCWGRHLWVYAEESGDPELVGLAVQKFLQKFRPDQCWSLTYSNTCSKPRVGEFGGGAIFVTAAEIKGLSTYEFVRVCEQEFNATRAGGASA